MRYTIRLTALGALSMRPQGVEKWDIGNDLTPCMQQAAGKHGTVARCSTAAQQCARSIRRYLDIAVAHACGWLRVMIIQEAAEREW